MPKSDFIPQPDTDYLAWHDQFKTGFLANAATFSLVAGDTTPITTDNTDYHTKITNVNATQATTRQAVADKNISRRNGEARARALARRIKAHPAYTAALGNLLGIVGPEDTTDRTVLAPAISGADRTGGEVQVNCGKLTSGGVRDTATPYIDNRPLLTAGKPEIREYKAMFVLSDEELGIFSHELVVNCAP